MQGPIALGLFLLVRTLLGQERAALSWTSWKLRTQGPREPLRGFAQLAIRSVFV